MFRCLPWPPAKLNFFYHDVVEGVQREGGGDVCYFVFTDNNIFSKFDFEFIRRTAALLPATRVMLIRSLTISLIYFEIFQRRVSLLILPLGQYDNYYYLQRCSKCPSSTASNMYVQMFRVGGHLPTQ